MSLTKPQVEVISQILGCEEERFTELLVATVMQLDVANSLEMDGVKVIEDTELHSSIRLAQVLLKSYRQSNYQASQKTARR